MRSVAVVRFVVAAVVAVAFDVVAVSFAAVSFAVVVSFAVAYIEEQLPWGFVVG